LVNPVEEVCDDEEHVQAEGVPLSKPTPALDQRPRNATEELHRLADREEGCHNAPPSISNATGCQDGIEGGLEDGVECLAEVEFEDDRRRASFVVALHQVGGEEEVVDDIPPQG
jgi:hypothetical protein